MVMGVGGGRVAAKEGDVPLHQNPATCPWNRWGEDGGNGEDTVRWLDKRTGGNCPRPFRRRHWCVDAARTILPLTLRQCDTSPLPLPSTPAASYPHRPPLADGLHSSVEEGYFLTPGDTLTPHMCRDD